MKISSLWLLARVPFSVALGASTALAGGVRIVEPTGTQNFATIQAAVNAAPGGSVILIGEGSYSGFSVNGKSLSIYGVPGANVTVGSTFVTGIASNQVLIVSGLAVGVGPTSTPLTVSNSTGLVRFQDCRFVAWDFDWTFCDSAPGAGKAGARITNSTQVAFSNCIFRGGKSENQDDSFGMCANGPPGGPGLEALGTQGSKIVLYDCQFQGGQGGAVDFVPGDGGAGASISNTQVFASGCSFLGGAGGQNYLAGPPTYGCDADGGSGCLLNGSQLDEIGCSFQGGFGGFGSLGECTPGNAPGVSGGSVTSMAGPARRATIASTVQSDASTWSVAYQGAPGDRPLLLTAASPQLLISLPFHGAWLLRRNTLLSATNFGMVDPSGALDGVAPTSDLPAGSLLQQRPAQVAVRATVGVYLGSARDVVLLDRSSGPDCNGNGVSDFLDVIEGASADANHNLIPDSCPGG